MCGIAGVVGHFSELDADGIVHSMVRALKHRGPDDQGVCTLLSDPHVVSLGNTRLAIQDLSAAGHQPMTETSGRYWVAFNGEIYNFQELRKLLDRPDCRFQTGTDTEAILHAFHRWSLKSFNVFRGMFAIALFDRETRKLYLVRDPLGIKPLYYFVDNQRLYFASEVRALLATGRIEPRVNAEALTHFLSYGWVGTTQTIVSGIQQLQPGHLLTVDLSRESMTWDIATYEEPLSSEPPVVDDERNESIGHVRHLLEQSVKAHLISDAPVGLFLSGGIDSTAILELMSRVGAATPKTFTVIFQEEDFNERRYAKRVALMYGADHCELELGEASLLAEMPEALTAMDQPTMDGVNSFVIAKAVRAAGVKVALSGLGGDELFAGYPSHRRAHLARRVARLPRPARRAIAAGGRSLLQSPRLNKVWDLLGSDCTPASAYRISRRLFEPQRITELAPQCVVPLESPESNFSGDEVNEASRLEMSGYMTNLLLRDTDFMSMANSLEVRVPFLDKALVRYVLRVSGQWKLVGSTPKPLLLEAMRGSIPKSIWHRRKMGFVLPFERWMLSSFRQQIEQTLRDSALARSAGLCPQAVEQTWDRFLKGAVQWSQPWSLFVLLRWCERFGASI